MRTRSLDDFIKYGLYIVSAILIILFIIFLVSIIRSGLPKLTSGDVVLLLFAIIIVLPIIGISYYSTFASIKDLYLWILSPSLSNSGAMFLTALLTFMVGLSLFYFRLRARAIYGVTEAAIGLVVAAHRVATEDVEITSTSFYLAILTASVYLVVRGLDNVHQGLIKDPVDPYGTKLFNILKRRI